MNITYNDKTPEYFDCWLATRPVIEPSEVDIDRYKIPGRRGELIGAYETRRNAHISFKLHQKASPNNLEKAMVWLRETGKWLILSDDTAYMYKVVASEVTAYQNKADNYKRIEVDLEVDPFKYRAQPTIVETINPSSTVTFTLDTDECEPIYEFDCTTTSGTITVNGNTFTVYNSLDSQTNYDEITIDVHRKISYYTRNKKNASNKVMGDYADLNLKNGLNTVQTSAGVTLIIGNTHEGYII